MDVRTYNRAAWDKAVERDNPWTRPVSSAQVAAARDGSWQVVLTPVKPVPAGWFPPLAGCRLLALAGGGGQQGPLFAAAGAVVTVFDNSPRQLGQDRLVAERDGLALTTVEGDMQDLGCFADGAFDLVFHPCSNCFVPDVRPVWREAFRVLRRSGLLLSGFLNPVVYTFDKALEATGTLQVKYPLPYSDVTSLTDAERDRYTNYLSPLEFGHTLADQLAGQVEAGFHLTGFYEDTWGGSEAVDRMMASFFATRALKPGV